jgi:hypothetical protein
MNFTHIHDPSRPNQRQSGHVGPRQRSHPGNRQ